MVVIQPRKERRMIAMDTKLKELRTSLEPKVSQEQISVLAGIRLTTYRNAESGKKVSFTTARGIHKALNGLRKERSLPDLDLFDLDLNIV